jgi:energy-coupling factor transport system substrate-specific component
LTILGSNVADKVISALIVWFVIRKMPNRLATTYTMLKYNRA